MAMRRIAEESSCFRLRVLTESWKVEPDGTVSTSTQVDLYGPYLSTKACLSALRVLEYENRPYEPRYAWMRRGSVVVRATVEEAPATWVTVKELDVSVSAS